MTRIALFSRPMKLPAPLLHGRLIKRYKRFLADVELENGAQITAHCANPGSMTGLKDPGFGVWLSQNNNPKRKLKYSWELVDVGGSLVGINTNFANRIVEEALAKEAISELTGYDAVRREVPYGENSRIDFLLQNQSVITSCYVEVKSVTLSRQAGVAEFPDAVTTRGAKHLRELGRMAQQGHRAVMLYLVQRTDCTRFRLAGDIDPAYKSAFYEARAQGVETLCYTCHISSAEITVAHALETI